MTLPSVGTHTPAPFTSPTRSCTKCGSTNLEKKGKNKDGSQRFGNLCLNCKAKRESNRYRKAKTLKGRKLRRRTFHTVVSKVDGVADTEILRSFGTMLGNALRDILHEAPGEEATS